MDIKKICPFRTQELMQGACNTDCQLFVIDQTTQEGFCALSALPAIKHAMVRLDYVLDRFLPAIVNIIGK